RVVSSAPLGTGVSAGSTNTKLFTFPTRRQTDQDEPYNPHATTAAAYHIARVWALPLSLATTQGDEGSFLSCGLANVSVPRLASSCAMESGRSTRALPRVGFPIRKSSALWLVSSFPTHIAAAHLL